MRREDAQFPYDVKGPVRDPKEGDKLAYQIRYGGMSERDMVFRPEFNWENYLANDCSLHKFDIHNMKAAGYLSLDPDGRAEILDGNGNSMNPRDEDGRTLYFSSDFDAWNLGRALSQHFKNGNFYCREFKATNPSQHGIKDALLPSQKKAQEVAKRKPVRKRAPKKS